MKKEKSYKFLVVYYGHTTAGTENTGNMILKSKYKDLIRNDKDYEKIINYIMEVNSKEYNFHLLNIVILNIIKLN